MRRIGKPPPEFDPVHVERLDEEALRDASDEELQARLKDAHRASALLDGYISDLETVIELREEGE